MAIQLGPHGGSDDDLVVDINTTPLIDVMLVLLVMLIITVPLQTHAVRLDLPSGPPPTQTVEPQVIVIAIDEVGQLRWNGDPIGEIGRLEPRFAALAPQTPQPEIHLRPDRHTRYGNVARVLAIAQRAGLTRIGIVGGTTVP